MPDSKQLKNILEIIVLFTYSSIIYGILHDQVTVRVCLEYFTVGHYPIFGEQHPTILAILWGTAATWWMGFLMGSIIALVASLGRTPIVPARQLVKPAILLLTTMAILAFIAGVAGYFMSESGFVHLTPRWQFSVNAAKHSAFIADGFAHCASYLAGIIGSIILIRQTWLKRKKHTEAPV